MKWTILLAALMVLLSTAASEPSGQSSGGMSSSGSEGAPTPITPTSADSLNLQIPSESSASTASQTTPSTQERSQTLISSSQEEAYSYAPSSEETSSMTYGSSGLGSSASGSMESYMGGTSSTYSGSTTLKSTGATMGEASSQSYSMIITPTGTSAPNRLYVSYASRTVASCNLYAYLPLWMNTNGQGSIWFYEWYPSGMLDTNYAGFANHPGWYKRWFYADTPGWHTMQYYCSGWSNYVYVYVYNYYGPMNGPYSGYDSMPYQYDQYNQYDQYPYEQGGMDNNYPPTGHTYSSTSSYGSAGSETQGI